MAAHVARTRRQTIDAPNRLVAEIVASTPGQLRLLAASAGTRVAEPMLAALDDLLRQADDASHAIVATRALRALARSLANAEAGALAGAGSAATDRDALIGLLLAEPDPTAPVEADPLARARLRGDQRRQTLLAEEGGTLGVTQVADRLSLTRQAVDKRRQAGRLLAVPAGRHGYRYPAWQFSETGLLSGLEIVLAALADGEHAAWMQLTFFLSGRSDLQGRRPLDLLRAGDVEAVITAARRLGEHGAV